MSIGIQYRLISERLISLLLFDVVDLAESACHHGVLLLDPVLLRRFYWYSSGFLIGRMLLVRLRFASGSATQHSANSDACRRMLLSSSVTPLLRSPVESGGVDRFVVVVVVDCAAHGQICCSCTCPTGLQTCLP